MACHRTLIGLICGQLTLAGYSIIRGGFYQALVIFPLPIITIKMLGVFKTLYIDPGECISVERAVELDAHNPMAASSFDADVYRQPVLAETIVEPQMRQDSALSSLCKSITVNLLFRVDETNRSKLISTLSSWLTEPKLCDVTRHFIKSLLSSTSLYNYVNPS